MALTDALYNVTLEDTPCSSNERDITSLSGVLSPKTKRIRDLETRLRQKSTECERLKVAFEEERLETELEILTKAAQLPTADLLAHMMKGHIYDGWCSESEHEPQDTPDTGTAYHQRNGFTRDMPMANFSSTARTSSAVCEAGACVHASQTGLDRRRESWLQNTLRRASSTFRRQPSLTKAAPSLVVNLSGQNVFKEEDNVMKIVGRRTWKAHTVRVLMNDFGDFSLEIINEDQEVVDTANELAILTFQHMEIDKELGTDPKDDILTIKTAKGTKHHFTGNLEKLTVLKDCLMRLL